MYYELEVVGLIQGTEGCKERYQRNGKENFAGKKKEVLPPTKAMQDPTAHSNAISI